MAFSGFEVPVAGGIRWPESASMLRDSGHWAGGLTDMGWCRFNEAVTGRGLLVFLAAVTLGSGARSVGEEARRALPLDLARSAAAAVEAMGVELAKGRVAVTLERMYSPWKDRAARRLGGMDKLVEVVVERRDRMQANGMQLVQFKAGMPTTGFEVKPVMKTDPVTGLKEVDHFQEWLVFVPTTIRYRVIEADTGKTRMLEKDGFQVAVAKQGTGEWKFIDGAKLTIEELRTLFPTLPSRRSQLGMPELSPWREPEKR